MYHENVQEQRSICVYFFSFLFTIWIGGYNGLKRSVYGDKLDLNRKDFVFKSPMGLVFLFSFDETFLQFHAPIFQEIHPSLGLSTPSNDALDIYGSLK